jgi:hypothetical protein
MATQTLNVIHVRFNGRSQDIPLEAIDLSQDASEARIRDQLSRYLEVPLRQMDSYVIDRHPNGNLTLRPEAVFG